MVNLTLEEIKEWYTLYQQVFNGWHLEPVDKQALLRLNHEVMLMSHEVHNNNMMEGK